MHCDVAKETSFESIKEKFETGVRDIREFEKSLVNWTADDFANNQIKTKDCVEKIVEIIKNK